MLVVKNVFSKSMFSFGEEDGEGKQTFTGIFVHITVLLEGF